MVKKRGVRSYIIDLCTNLSQSVFKMNPKVSQMFPGVIPVIFGLCAHSVHWISGNQQLGGGGYGSMAAWGSSVLATLPRRRGTSHGAGSWMLMLFSLIRGSFRYM